MPIPFFTRTCLAAAALALGATAPLAAADYGTLTITASPTPAVEGGAEAWFEIRRTPGADWPLSRELWPIIVEISGSAILDSEEHNLAGADISFDYPKSNPSYQPTDYANQDPEGGSLILDFSSNMTKTGLAAYVWLNPWAESFRIRVRAYDDGVTEPAENLTAKLLLVAWKAEMPFLQSSATVTIIDQTPPPTVAISASSGAEGGADGTLTFTRMGSGTENLLVNFSVAGTAKPTLDYQLIGAAENGTSVVIPAGATQAVVRIRPVDDKLAEGTETVVATLQTGSYLIGKIPSVTVSIADNDVPPPITFLTAQVGPGIPGSIAWLNPGWEMRGSGSGIAGLTENATEARFPYVGNNQFTVQISDVGGNLATAQAGILLRDALGNKIESIFITGGGRIGIARQIVKGGGITTTLEKTSVMLPVWLRAVRQGDSISYLTSPNGNAWKPMTTLATTLPSSYQAGLFVASGSTSPIKATIDRYTVVPVK